MSELRNVAVVHQILVLSDDDFEAESIYGYTELTLAATTDSAALSTINLNCKQCQVFCVVFNGVHEVTDYEYCDPSLIKPGSDETKRDLQTLLYQDELGRLSVDADEGNGELSIKLINKFFY